jgi:hypothetical protein
MRYMARAPFTLAALLSTPSVAQQNPDPHQVVHPPVVVQHPNVDPHTVVDPHSVRDPHTTVTHPITTTDEHGTHPSTSGHPAGDPADHHPVTPVPPTEHGDEHETSPDHPG